MKTYKKARNIKAGVAGYGGAFNMGRQHLGGRTVTTRYKNPRDEGFRYYENVAAFLTKKAPLVIAAEWSRHPIHILDLAARSAKAGKSLTAKYG